MKQLILGLCATLLFTTNIHSQNNYTKSAIVILVGAAKDTYFKGMTYEDWAGKFSGNLGRPTALEDRLLKEIYGYLVTEAKPETVYKNYNSNSLIELKKAYDKRSLTTLTTSNERCGFFCWLIRMIYWPELDEMLLLP